MGHLRRRLRDARNAGRLRAQRDRARDQRERARAERDRRRQRARDLRRELARLREERDGLFERLHRDRFDLTLPPEPLRRRVAGRGVVDFLARGKSTADEVVRLAATHGRPFSGLESVLDFGCGCGRVIRFLHDPTRSARLHGGDIDAEAIDWCRTQLGGVASFDVLPVDPPSAYPEGGFDLVVAVSVFTHLPEDLERRWLAEIRRILRPGGLLLATVHGPDFFSRVPAARQPELEERGFLYADLVPTPGLPDFYRTSFHTDEYVRATWSEWFDIRDVTPEGLNRQDCVVALG